MPAPTAPTSSGVFYAPAPAATVPSAPAAPAQGHQQPFNPFASAPPQAASGAQSGAQATVATTQQPAQQPQQPSSLQQQIDYASWWVMGLLCAWGLLGWKRTRQQHGEFKAAMPFVYAAGVWLLTELMK